MNKAEAELLVRLWRNAKDALTELSDHWLEFCDIGWKPTWGLIQGCIEQMDDIWDEMYLESYILDEDDISYLQRIK